jgi:mycoredoxin
VRQVGNIEVFWRPGCPFCMKLRATLALRNVKVRWINIWEDDEARQFVREANGGNETVPTVRRESPDQPDLAPVPGGA